MAKEQSLRRAADYTVIVDLPDPLPITEAEIEMLERELADFFEELLGEGVPRGSREEALPDPVRPCRHEQGPTEPADKKVPQRCGPNA
jgi:hypothetical protein